MKDEIKNPKYVDFKPESDGVKKIRRSPLIIIAFLITIFIFIQMFNVSSKKERKANKEKEERNNGVAMTSKAQTEKWFESKEYDSLRMKSLENQFKVDGDQESTFDVRNENERLSPVIENKITTKPTNKFKEDLNPVNAEALKDYQLALKSPGQIANFKHQRSNVSTTGGASEVDANQAGINGQLLNALQNRLGDDAGSSQKDKLEFLRSGVTPGHYLPHFKEKALSKYEIKAGSFIRAALITKINTDLPGNVTAQVTQNIYDSVTGRYLLIPQASRLIGEFDSNVSFGQGSALVTWSRLIFPDGSSINLEKMQGVDLSGEGFKDKVNHHYFRIYSNALLLSLVGAGYDALNPSDDTKDTVNNIAANIGQQLAQTTSELTKRNLDVQPTIIIRPGYKFNVFVMKDMILEEISNDGSK